MRNGTRKQFIGICTVTGVLLSLGAPLFVSEAEAQWCSRGTTPNVACRSVITPADRNQSGPEHQSQFPGGLPRGQYASGVTTSIPYAGTYNSMRYGIGPREFGFGPQVTVTEYIQREQGSADLIWVTTAQGRRVPFVTRGNELVSEEQPTGDLRKAYATKTAVTITDPQTGATVVYGQIARNVIGLPSTDELLMPTKFIDSAGDTVTTMTYQASAPHILASIEDRFGNKTTFTMVNGVIKTMTNPDGVTIGYIYDQRPGEQLAHLIAVSVPDPKQNTVWTGEWDPTYRHLLTKFSLNGAQPSTTEIQYANPSGVVEAVVRAHNGKDQTFTGYVTTEDSVLVRTESAIDQKAVFSFTQYADSPTGDGQRYPVLLASGDGIYNKDKNSGVVSAQIELGYYGFPVSSTDMWGRTLKVRYVEGDGCSDRSIGATSPFPLCSSSVAGETRVKRLAINGAPTEVANFDPTGKRLAVCLTCNHAVFQRRSHPVYKRLNEGHLGNLPVT